MALPENAGFASLWGDTGARINVVRFPNSSSNIDHFVAVYVAALEAHRNDVVEIDDIVYAVVAAGLATSSGYLGDEALLRSTRADRSRDPLYNQLKMYTEVFRALGWLASVGGVSLRFRFTPLGEKLALAGVYYLGLVEECALGISFPNNVLSVTTPQRIRPIATILRVMARCGGYLSKAEMLLGPLSAPSDRSSSDIDAIVARVLAVRQSRGVQRDALRYLAASTRRGVQVNTLTNYTRVPVALLRDTGWAVSSRKSLSDRSKYQVFSLTDKGQARVEWLEGAVDIRLDDVRAMSAPEARSLGVAGYYEMLSRAGFDTTPVIRAVEDSRASLLASGTLSSRDVLLYSPLQVDAEGFMGTEQPDVGEALPRSRGSRTPQEVARPTLGIYVDAVMLDRGAIAPILGSVPDLERELDGLVAAGLTLDSAVAQFVDAHAQDTQQTFYPLVRDLFRLLGAEAEISRYGVNYQRWDAQLTFDPHTLPVEIKSPMEERFLSMKAVRQALENKVIAMSRGGDPTGFESSSLIVGFQYPNQRGDMAQTIVDVHSAFDVRVGVLDLATLTTLVLRPRFGLPAFDVQQLISLRGFLSV